MVCTMAASASVAPRSSRMRRGSSTGIDSASISCFVRGASKRFERLPSSSSPSSSLAAAAAPRRDEEAAFDGTAASAVSTSSSLLSQPEELSDASSTTAVATSPSPALAACSAAGCRITAGWY